MVKAIRYLHDHNVVHRDLKLENFLFETDSEDSELILIDFGLSQIYYPNEVILNPVGTPYYVAPEVLNGAYGNKCDVWSIGVIAYMLVSGTPPFYGKTDNDTLRAVQKGRLTFAPALFDHISPECKDFIKSCLNRAVTHRPSAEALLSHAWFKDLRDESQTHAPSLNIMTRLVLYNERSMLTKVCMEVVAHTLDTEQLSSLRKQFQALDANNRGEILFSDLKNILQRDNKISPANMEILLKSSKDAPDDLVIKYHEFLASTISRQQINDNNMRVAFEKMSNHSDVITHASILDLLGKTASDETVSQMMLEVNVDPESAITFDKVNLLHTLINCCPSVSIASMAHTVIFFSYLSSLCCG
jgi:calcium-dependent protein kinase